MWGNSFILSLSLALISTAPMAIAAGEIDNLKTPITFVKPIQGKGKVFKAADGDTVYLSIPVRLLNIDCHETKHNPRAEFQAKNEGVSLDKVYTKGQVAKEYVQKAIENSNYNVRYVLKGQDKYGRMLGEINSI